MKKAFSLIELSIVILIIGILVAGVTQSSRLVAQMRLTSARTITQSSPVNSIRDITLWFDATSEKAFDVADMEDAHTITNWYTTNLVANSQITVSQATAGNKPLYYLSKFNSLPSVYFDGSNDCLFNSSVLPRDIVQAKEVTLFVVQNFIGSSAAVNSSVIWLSVTADSASRFNLHSPESGGSYGYISFDSGSGSPDRATYTIPSAKAINAPILISAFRKNATSEIRLNGGSAVASSSTVASDMPIATSVLSVGCIDPAVDPAYSFYGYIGEIIVFDRALKTEERQVIEKYLGKKWGIKVS